MNENPCSEFPNGHVICAGETVHFIVKMKLDNFSFLSHLTPAERVAEMEFVARRSDLVDHNVSLTEARDLLQGALHNQRPACKINAMEWTAPFIP